MKKTQLLRFLLLIALLFSVTTQSYAHDPGLSRARVTLNEADLTLQLEFSRQDIEALQTIDSNHDGKVTVDEFSAAQAGLSAIMTAAVEVFADNSRQAPKSLHIEQAKEDDVNITIHYEGIKAPITRLQIPLLAQLARGHRQYLIVQNADAELLSQHILDARSSSVLLKNRGIKPFRVFQLYLVEGVWHIWMGFDHMLFLLTLLLPAVLIYRTSGWQSQDSLRPALVDTLKVVTAFTIAHSITLALAVLNIVILPSRLVESVIAVSVLITAANNLRPVISASRWLLAFIFGLVHGFGFATVLVDLGLPANALTASLMGFNLGVEAGQLAIVALVFPLTALIRHSTLYRIWILRGSSSVAMMIATIWLFERAFEYDVIGF